MVTLNSVQTLRSGRGHPCRQSNMDLCWLSERLVVKPNHQTPWTLVCLSISTFKKVELLSSGRSEIWLRSLACAKCLEWGKALRQAHQPTKMQHARVSIDSYFKVDSLTWPWSLSGLSTFSMIAKEFEAFLLGRKRLSYLWNPWHDWYP